MSLQDLRTTQSSQQTLDDNQKPLRRVQQYLVELRVSITLLRELLVEVKELIVILALIAFFIWGVIQLFQHLHS
jgi:hypothetical protein